MSVHGVQQHGSSGCPNRTHTFAQVHAKPAVPCAFISAALLPSVAPYLLFPVEVHNHGAVRSGGDEGRELHHKQAQHEEAVKEKGVVSG